VTHLITVGVRPSRSVNSDDRWVQSERDSTVAGQSAALIHFILVHKQKYALQLHLGMCQWLLVFFSSLTATYPCTVLNSTLFSDCHYIISRIIELLNCICFVLEHLLETSACPSVSAALDVTQPDMALGLSHETAPNPVQCNTIPHFYSIHSLALLKEAFTCPQRQHSFSHISSM